MLGTVEVLARVAHDPRPRAVAAVARALRCDEHQDAVGISVDQARDGGVSVLGERVLHHRGERFVLAVGGDDLAADRVVGIVGVYQADEVRRDVHAELVGSREAVALVGSEVQDLLDLFERVHAVGHLPAPVVPALVGDIGPDGGAAAHGGASVRAQGTRRIAAVHERGLGRRRHAVAGLGSVGRGARDRIRTTGLGTGHRSPPGAERINAMQSACGGDHTTGVAKRRMAR